MKKFLSYIFTICLIVPCMFFFTACEFGTSTVEESDSEIRAIYALAVENGETRTYEEWLESIKGERGPKGDKGEDGKDGRDGIDGETPTIEINQDGYWVINGVTTDVKAAGTDGKDGTNGKDGKDGTNGKDGANGKDGTNGKDGKDGTDATYEMYTITYDYGATKGFFDGAIDTYNIKSTQWLTTIPTIKEEYKDSFIGWFIDGTDRQIAKYDFIGGNVTLYAKFDENELGLSGLYQNGKYVKTWSNLQTEYPNMVYNTTLTSVLGTLSGSLIIDSSITRIGSDAFSDCSRLTSITIPSSVTSIGDIAFSGCSGLTSITIPSSVTSIGSSAFRNCSNLTSITIPSSVTSIGSRAFSGCSGLTSIEVASGNTKYDSRNNSNAIIETYTNTLIAGCQNTVIPNTVTSIDSGAFLSCSGLTSITIPSSVTSIGDNAFSGCSGLTSITIPSDVTSIGTSAFSVCSSLTRIDVASGNTKYDSRNNCNAIIETSTNTLIVGCKDTVIPSSVTSIGNYAFSYCSGLTSITIPSSVTSIGYIAFSGCSGLTCIEVDPNNNTYDSRNNCNAIIETNTNTLIAGCKDTVIPSTVTSIGTNAFFGCSSLTSITIPEGVKSIGNSAFFGCTSLEIVTIVSERIYGLLSSNYACGGLIDYATTLYISKDITLDESHAYLNETNYDIDTTTNTAYYIFTKKN